MKSLITLMISIAMLFLCGSLDAQQQQPPVTTFAPTPPSGVSPSIQVYEVTPDDVTYRIGVGIDPDLIQSVEVIDYPKIWNMPNPPVHNPVQLNSSGGFLWTYPRLDFPYGMVIKFTATLEPASTTAGLLQSGDLAKPDKASQGDLRGSGSSTVSFACIVTIHPG